MIEEVTTGMLDKVLAQIPGVFNLSNTCFEAILDNEILLFFFTVSMVGVGLRVFRKMKKTAR